MTIKRIAYTHDSEGKRIVTKVEYIAPGFKENILIRSSDKHEASQDVREIEVLQPDTVALTETFGNASREITYFNKEDINSRMIAVDAIVETLDEKHNRDEGLIFRYEPTLSPQARK